MIPVKDLPYAPREIDPNETILYVEQCCGVGDNPTVDVSQFKTPAVLFKETYSMYYGFHMKREDMKGTPYTHQFFIGER